MPLLSAPDKTATVTMNQMTVTDIFTCTEKSRAYGVTKEQSFDDKSPSKHGKAPDLGRILFVGAACNNARLCPPEKIKSVTGAAGKASFVQRATLQKQLYS